MSRFTFVTWDGGGNVPPAVGIAQELIARGNEVRFLGYLPQQAAIRARGLAFSTAWVFRTCWRRFHISRSSRQRT